MKLLARFCIVVLALPLLFVSPAFAKGTNTPKTITLAKNEVVDSDYFAAGDKVTLSGTVNGDAYVAGGTVTVHGTVNGDLFVAGGTVHIDGSILHDLRAAGGTITVTSPIPGNVTVSGGNVSFSKNAKVGGSILAGAGTLEVLGPIGRGITVGAGSLTIGDRVLGSIKAGVGNLSLLPDANVSGDLTYWSEESVNVADGATISGTVLRHEPPENKTGKDLSFVAGKNTKKVAAATLGAFTIWKIVYFLITFVVGLVLFSLLPVYTKKVADVFKKQPFQEFGIGLITVIVMPVLAVILLTTIVGIPVGLFLFAALGLLAFVAHIYAGLALGEVILGWMNTKFSRTLAYLVGLTSLLILSLIPILGGITKAIVELMAIGAIMTQKYAIMKQMRSKRMI